MAFIKKNIALGAIIGEIYQQDRWEYPLEAVREALINAIIHRDYAILGSDIKLTIYDDMLEITNPGPLPDSLPIEELGTGRSEIRNRVLAPSSRTSNSLKPGAVASRRCTMNWQTTLKSN